MGRVPEARDFELTPRGPAPRFVQPLAVKSESSRCAFDAPDVAVIPAHVFRPLSRVDIANPAL
jgi:hypothetical protein